MRFYVRNFILLCVAFIGSFCARADYEFQIGAELNLGTAKGDFAPYYLSSNRFGKVTQAETALLDVWATDSLDLFKRFDFSWGLEAMVGVYNKVAYRQWNSDTHDWFWHLKRPAPVWIQQLFAEVKWRCLFLSVGLKDRESCFVDQELSSGDLLWSGNSKAIPEVRIGFVDFQDIPFTKKWVQFDVALSYGKFIDTRWINSHFDYYSGKRNPGGFWTYKKAALRTNPQKPFMFQVGIQMAGIFGGYTYYYDYGELREVVDNYNGFKDFFRILFPFWSDSREGYRVGDTKGTWDFAARYRFKSGESLRAYVQWPWEDSSGIYKFNGYDGLWGLEFKLNRPWWISGAVLEYLDLTHMGGPIAYDPGFHNTSQNGATIPSKVGGRDSYYNNYYYRAYTNYGMIMGTPMVMGTIFDTGENPNIRENGALPYFRVRGLHVALKGEIGRCFSYVVKYNHRKAWGDTNSYTLIHPVEADSFMAGVSCMLPWVWGLKITGSIGVDHGSMPSNTVGGSLTLSYVCPVLFK